MVNPNSAPSSTGNTGEAPVVRDLGDLGKYSDGINLETLTLKPFEIDIKNFYTEEELEEATAHKLPDQAAQMRKENREKMIHNNEELDKLDLRILHFYDLDPAELDAAYDDPEASETDKSIIAGIDIIRKSYHMSVDSVTSEDQKQLINSLPKAIEGIYAFRLIAAREQLKQSGIPLNILTEKERRDADPAADMVSAALESFVRNPNYDTSRIGEYARYLYGIMLDCAEPTIEKEGRDAAEVTHELNLDEFQNRIIESMSGERLGDVPSGRIEADYATGRHFFTEQEVAAHNKYGAEHKFMPRNFWRDFGDRVRKNSREVFKYNKKVATIEMEHWTETIDFDLIEQINDDETIPYQDKAEAIKEGIRVSFGVDPGVVLGWKESSFSQQVAAAAGLPTTQGSYDRRTRTIFMMGSESTKTKLTDEEISTLAHELWHAKQYQMMAQPQYSSHDIIKQRMYMNNNRGYASSEEGKAYRLQIMEREAFAIGSTVLERLKKRHKGKTGRSVLGAYSSN